MRVLLDTHTFIWFFTADTRLSQQVRQVIEDPKNFKLLSSYGLTAAIAIV